MNSRPKTTPKTNHTRDPRTVPFSHDHQEKGLWFVLFFALLFFMSSSDIFFATRIFGFNVRFGQLLLLPTGLLALAYLGWEAKLSPALFSSKLRLVAYWAPFFLAYGLAAALSPTPKLTFTKWVWALFNIGFAGLVCLSDRWKDFLVKGLEYGIYAIAGFLWVEAITIYWFGVTPALNHLPGPQPLYWHLGNWPFLIGHAQPTFKSMGFLFFRPNVFYYEPSYAGCALAFAFPIVMAVNQKNHGWASLMGPAFVLSAVILCGARSGLLSIAISTSLILLYTLARGQKRPFFSVLKVIGISLLLVLVFSLSSYSRKYFEFLIGPMGTASTERIHSTGASEGDRIQNMKQCLLLWNKHLYLGNGVIPLVNGESGGLSQVSMNTWLEIGLESGLLGFMAFWFAFLGSLREGLLKNKDTVVPIFVLAACASHLIVHLNFTQTFPRLDYWLIFFLSLRLLFESEKSNINGKMSRA